jgi:hypothetical protein
MRNCAVDRFDYYVYAYYELHGTEPFYIGKGRGRRAYEHLTYANKNKSTVLAKKIRSLIEPPRIEFLYENFSEGEALELEIQTIDFYGRRCDGGCLVNETCGGEGVSGRKHTEESKQRMSDARKRHPATWTQERKQEYSDRMKGNTVGVEYAKSIRRPIVSKSCGIIVGRYETASDVKRDGYSRSLVCRVLRGEATLDYG